MKSTSKKSFLKKLIISYAAILILPILVMSFSVYRQFDSVLKKELITNHTNSLERAAYILDSNISNLYTVNEKLISDTITKSTGNLSNPEIVLTMQTEFNKYLVSNSFIKEIAVYFHGEDYIYTSKSSYQVSDFIDKYYIFSEWDNSAFISDINTISEITVRKAETATLPNSSESKIITFMYPVRHSNQISATLMFFVDQAYIENVIKSTTEESSSGIIILDNKENTIVSTYENYSSYDNIVKEFLNSDEKTSTIDLGNKKFQISAISDTTNQTYIMLTPLSHVLKKEHDILISSIAILLLVLIAGVLVIIWSLRITYRPIKALREFSADIARVDLNTNDELETIKGTISHLADEKENIINKSSHMTEEYILENMIKGRYASATELKEQIKPFNISFNTNYYAVLILLVHNKKNEKELIKKLMNRFFSGIIKEEHQISGRYVAIVTPENSNFGALSQSVKSFLNALYDEFDIHTTIGVGNIYEDIKKIPLSYIQACSAIDYRLIKGNRNVITYSSVSSLIEDYQGSYPNNNIESLKYQIKKGDIENINYILDSTLEFIKKENIPLFIARNLCFDMINTVWKTFTEIQKTHVLPTNDYPNITVLSKYDTVDDLIQILKNFCSNICSEFNASNEKNEESLLNSILNYIKDNYRDGNFTVQIMADHFDMSLTNISQYFKARTGQTIINYITGLRIAEAKELLLNTEMSINEIALSVGYLNSSSFIRRFKQITGLTPKQFTAEYK